MKKVLLVLRHENSLALMDDFARQHDLEIMGVALDPIEAAADVDAAMKRIETLLPLADVVAIGTKVYNTDKAVSRLPEFMQVLKNLGLRDEQPVCITHLETFQPDEIGALLAFHDKLSWVEEDNIGRHGPQRFGALILEALS